MITKSLVLPPSFKSGNTHAGVFTCPSAERSFPTSGRSLFALALIAASIQLTSETRASGISEDFLARSKRVAELSTRSSIVDFGNFLIEREESLTFDELERGDRTLSSAMATFSREEIALLLGELKGVRSPSLAGLAMTMVEAEFRADEAMEFLKSTPKGIFDYFLRSIEGTKYRGQFLFALHNEALIIALAEMNAATDSRRKLRVVGLLTTVIRKKRESLDPNLVHRTLLKARDSILTMDPKDQGIAEEYLRRLEEEK